MIHASPKPGKSAVIICIASYFLWILSGCPQTPITKVVPIAAVAILLLHLIIEKYRWQVIPLYFMCGAASINFVYNLRHVTEPIACPAWIQIFPVWLGSIPRAC